MSKRAQGLVEYAVIAVAIAIAAIVVAAVMGGALNSAGNKFSSVVGTQN